MGDVTDSGVTGRKATVGAIGGGERRTTADGGEALGVAVLSREVSVYVRSVFVLM